MMALFAEDDRTDALQKLRKHSGEDVVYECALCAVTGNCMAFSIQQDLQGHSLREHGIAVVAKFPDVI